MSTKTTREALLEKRRKIDAKIKAIEARERSQKRKDETRRKIIIGSVVMTEAASDPLFRQRIGALIEAHASDKDKAFLTPWLTDGGGVAAAPQEAQGADIQARKGDQEGGRLPAPFIKR